MQTDRFDQLLREVVAPESAAARERTVAAARAEAREAPTRGGVFAPRLRTAIVFAGVLLLGIAGATPAGQAAVEWVTDLVGGPDDFDTRQEAIEGGVVIGEGRAPDGSPYQVIATKGVGDGHELVPCIELHFPAPTGEEPIGAGRCEGVNRSPVFGDEAMEFPIVLEQPGSDPGVVVAGLASSEVERAQVVYEASDAGGAKEAPTALFRLEDPTREQIGAKAPVNFVVGFLPGDAGSVTSSRAAKAIAYDAEGQEIEQAAIRWALARLGNREYFVPCPSPQPAFQPACRGSE